MSNEKRAPLFKLEDVKCAMKAQGWSCSDEEARKALHFIDAKITSGELRVVEKATNVEGKSYSWWCSVCNWSDDQTPERPLNFCPGCGNPIAK